MSKRALKKYLQLLPKEDLEAQLIDLYDKFPSVKTFYNFVFNPRESKLIEEAKGKIHHEFFPKNGRKPRLRRSTAQKFIKQYVLLEVDSYKIADLMLYAIETAQTYSIKKPFKQDAFYNGILSSFNQALRFLIAKQIYSDFQSRVEAVKEETIRQQWRNSYEFEILLEQFEV